MKGKVELIRNYLVRIPKNKKIRCCSGELNQASVNILPDVEHIIGGKGKIEISTQSN